METTTQSGRQGNADASQHHRIPGRDAAHLICRRDTVAAHTPVARRLTPQGADTRRLDMFSHIRNALALTVAALAALALTTSAGFAAQQPTYDAYYDGLRIQATQTVRLPATSTRTTAIRSWRTLQPRYDARLDGLRIVSQSTSNERKLTVVRRPVARASAGGAGTQRSA